MSAMTLITVSALITWVGVGILGIAVTQLQDRVKSIETRLHNKGDCNG